MADERKEDQEARAREAVRRMIRNAPQLFAKEMSRKFYRAHMEVAEVDTLVALAREGDKDALDILRKYARGARRASMNAPQSLHELVWELFIDGPPPAKSGKSFKDTGLKHLTIALMVKIVVKDYRLPEYRNAEHRKSKSGPISACLLVAQELGLKERWVEEIWADQKAIALRH
jgi:predicted NBD/HSP70 family sugar kinase